MKVLDDKLNLSENQEYDRQKEEFDPFSDTGFYHFRAYGFVHCYGGWMFGTRQIITTIYYDLDGI